VSGFSLGFWVIGAFAAVAVVATLALVRDQQVVTEPATQVV
jgi:hypothetical protein